MTTTQTDEPTAQKIAIAYVLERLLLAGVRDYDSPEEPGEGTGGRGRSRVTEERRSSFAGGIGPDSGREAQKGSFHRLYSQNEQDRLHQGRVPLVVYLPSSSR